MTRAPTFAALASLLLTFLRAELAPACIPSAERVLAWDLTKDLVVVGLWTERGSPPPSGATPSGFELRRISTGERMASGACPDGPAAACRHEVVFAGERVAGVRWRARGTPMRRGRLRLRQRRTPALLDVALEARTGAGWQWLLWIDALDAGAIAQERRSYSLGPFDAGAGDALVVVERRARGGNCPYTVVRAFRVALADLDDPRRPQRHAALLASPRHDQPFEHWRSVAQLGRIPAQRLLEAIEAADEAAQPAFGARWWRETTSALPAAEVRQLSEAFERHPRLHATRALLGLPIR